MTKFYNSDYDITYYLKHIENFTKGVYFKFNNWSLKMRLR